MARRGKLNVRERLFVREYLIDLNATQAAIRAGYSPKWAPKRGSLVLQPPAVAKAAIEAAMAARAAGAGNHGGEGAWRELALMGFANVTDLRRGPGRTARLDVDLSRLTREQGAAIG